MYAMADWFEYRTLHVNMASRDGIVNYDSGLGDNPRNSGKGTPILVDYLNEQDVGRDGWEVCGVVPAGLTSTVILKRHKHT